jgi:DDE superfamily endonuclease
VDSKRRLLIVDNAGWHKAQRLNWHHFEVHFLQGYSPDFNPIERLWLRLKVDFFSDFIAKSSEQLTNRLCHALTSLMNDPLLPGEKSKALRRLVQAAGRTMAIERENCKDPQQGGRKRWVTPCNTKRNCLAEALK